MILPWMSKFFESSLPDSKLRRVVLPEPEGPKMAVIVPGENLPEQTFKILR